MSGGCREESPCSSTAWTRRSGTLACCCSFTPSRSSYCWLIKDRGQVAVTGAIPSPVRQMCARADGGSPSALVRALRSLDVVVEVELPRVGTEADGVDLVLALVGEPGVDHVLGEHAALEQELVVGLERGQGVVERAGDLRDLGELLGR